jgi:hypothetical protein
MRAALWFSLLQLPSGGCVSSEPGVEPEDGVDAAGLDATVRADARTDLPTDGAVDRRSDAMLPDAMTFARDSPERTPCCAIDGGAAPPSAPLEGCSSALVGEAPLTPDICAINGVGVTSSVSIPLPRKLLAGHSYRYSFTQLRLIKGDPIIVDVFGSDQPCVRKDLLFTLTLDGRFQQELCFTPQHDVFYTVTRVQVGTISYNYELDPIADTCETGSCS